MHEVIIDAVRAKRESVREARFCDFMRVNNDLMTEFIEFVADRLLVHPGRAGEEGRRDGRPTSGPFLQEARRVSMA